MAVLLFRLRGVPDDEADDIRELLTEHSIDYYETPAGNWGISMPSLWLRDESQLSAAKALIDHYQAERQAQAREAAEQLRSSGQHRGMIDEFRANPVRFIAFVLIALVVLYFSTKPFLDLATPSGS